MAAPSVSYATFFLRVSLEFGHVGFIFDGMRKENWDIDEYQEAKILELHNGIMKDKYTSPIFVTGTPERNGSQYRNTIILIKIIRMIN
ncbi:unnamed protein product [Rhizophagus irregularis]|nr:unnamed protein product [Rhizophagus irregularis]